MEVHRIQLSLRSVGDKGRALTIETAEEEIIEKSSLRLSWLESAEVSPSMRELWIVQFHNSFSEVVRICRIKFVKEILLTCTHETELLLNFSEFCTFCDRLAFQYTYKEFSFTYIMACETV